MINKKIIITVLILTSVIIISSIGVYGDDGKDKKSIVSINENLVEIKQIGFKTITDTIIKSEHIDGNTKIFLKSGMVSYNNNIISDINFKLKTGMNIEMNIVEGKPICEHTYELDGKIINKLLIDIVLENKYDYELKTNEFCNDDVKVFQIIDWRLI